ncbi:MAG: hypothetical protein NZ866_00560 [Patescibacteria group bacterium]|nr:hypothetical protein [Patescibacteria group bacterium]
MKLNYDIRGKYPNEINENLAKFLIRKFIKFIKKRKGEKILIAQDIRRSSKFLVNACLEQLSKENFNHKYLGILPTPLFYYSCLKENHPGIIITASHLPEKYNGFKFFLPPFEIWRPKKLEKIVNKKFSKKKITFTEKLDENLYLDYLNELKKLIVLRKNHNFYYSSKNKSVNNFLFNLLPRIFRKIKFNPKSPYRVFSDLDGDRLWISYRNKIISPEIFLLIILKSSNYQKIGIPITIHKKVKNFFPDKKFYLVKTGHLNFKKSQEKYDLDFALEPSYHFYFFKEFKTEAPIFVLLKFFQFTENFNLEKLVKIEFPFRRFETKNKKIIQKILKYVKINNFKRKKFDDYYFYQKIDKKNYLAINLRQSKTEDNIYRIFIEASDYFFIEKILNFIKKND